jgi:hypothetical protein
MELAVGISTNIRAKIRDLFFIPTAEKLIINPSKEKEELFQLADTAASALYETLPYTPITAIGHNFSYELEESETFSLSIDFSVSNCEELYKNIDVKTGNNSLVQHSLFLSKDSYVVLNLSFKIIDDKKIISMNYHYLVNNDNNRIKHALGKFNQNYQHSKIITSQLITNGVK